MDVRQLSCFCAVAQHRHFTHAGEVLGLSQSSVSHHVQQLEASLGVELFARTSRTVRLTPAGEALLPRAEQIVDALAQAETEMREFAGATRGRLALGTMRALGPIRLPEVLQAFSRHHPGIDIVMREDSTERMVEMLAAGDLDVAFIQLPDAPLPAGVSTEVIHVEDFVIVVGPHHPLAGRAEVDMRALAREDFIVFTRGSGVDGALRAACAAAGFAPHAKFESSMLQTVRSLAAAGLGVAMLPRSFAEDDDGAAIVAIAPPTPVRRVGVAWSDRAPATAGAFVRFVGLGTSGARSRPAAAASPWLDVRTRPPATGRRRPAANC
jgi:DNA-binding transcriptional LysR family regulator